MNSRPINGTAIDINAFFNKNQNMTLYSSYYLGVKMTTKGYCFIIIRTLILTRSK